MKILRHHVWQYLTLCLILGIGAALRFWQLDFKPLWLDEVITALFTLGHTYGDIPVGSFFSLAELAEIFTYKPGVSCAQIAETVSVESVHPPLFFCLMYRWMGWLSPTVDNWVWSLRSLPALIGVGAIAALYFLNRVAFSPAAGLMGAALMAVSPFAVYLSQESRHYTLPMLLITLALAGLVQIQQGLQRRQLHPLPWLGWIAVNIVGLYVHYFFILAAIAQVATLIVWMGLQWRSWPRQYWAAVGLAVSGIGLGYLPWLSTLLGHFNRPETDWLKRADLEWLEWFAPLYQTLAGWVLMVIVLPVENQPWYILLPSALIMLGFAAWLTRWVIRGWKQLWQNPSSRDSMFLLAGFTLCILLQFFAVAYILGKDITVIPRYNFVYYPGICALLSACLVQVAAASPEKPSSIEEIKSGRSLPPSYSLLFTPTGFFKLIRLYRTQAVVILVGVISSTFVIHGFAFHKSYYPETVAQNMMVESSQPLSFVMSYRSFQEIALGLSFALELQKYHAVLGPNAEPSAGDEAPIRFAFLDRNSGYSQVWRKLARLQQPLIPPLNLWVVASPGMRSEDYPNRLELSTPQEMRGKVNCRLDPEHYHRLGFPYQMYQCELQRSRQDSPESAENSGQ